VGLDAGRGCGRPPAEAARRCSMCQVHMQLPAGAVCWLHLRPAVVMAAPEGCRPAIVLSDPNAGLHVRACACACACAPYTPRSRAGRPAPAAHEEAPHHRPSGSQRLRQPITHPAVNGQRSAVSGQRACGSSPQRVSSQSDVLKPRPKPRCFRKTSRATKPSPLRSQPRA
jgi:hypothetical protein